MGLDSVNSPKSTNSSNSLDDDELTNLTWLQDNNLLQNMTKDNDKRSSDLKILKEDDENVSPKKVRPTDGEKKTQLSAIASTTVCTVPPVQYNPLLHVKTKPPYSFSSLIAMAIESSSTKALPVKDIYGWISKNFPYYQEASDGWKNTVRHNLSLNKCFQKIEKSKKFKDANEADKKLLNEQLASKGSLWCIDQHMRPNLLQSIKKAPAHIYPYMSTAKTVAVSNNISPSNNTNQISPKKIIALEKLPQKNVLTTAKRVLIPIAKVGRREPEEADAAESMLTLTTQQRNAPNNVNFGNAYYIIANKSNNLMPITINKPVVRSSPTVVKQQTPTKNQITILTRPIIQASPSRPTATIAINRPIITLAKDQNKNATLLTPVNTSKFTTSTDHNYTNRKMNVRPMSNVITLPITSLPISSLAGQKLFLTTTNNKTTIGTAANFTPINKTINKIIIAPPNSTLASTLATKNILINSPVKQLTRQQSTVTQTNSIKKPTTTITTANTTKNKVDVVNDEDGLKCAEALFNLANGSNIVKLIKNNSNVEKKSTESSEEAISRKQTVDAASSSTLTRSAAKRLKTSA